VARRDPEGLKEMAAVQGEDYLISLSIEQSIRCKVTVLRDSGQIQAL
jgi:hypothetical protein